jgi:hypothetical protein
MSEQEKTAARYFEKFRKSLRVGATVFGIGGLAATGVGVYTLEHTLSGAATKELEQLAPNLKDGEAEEIQEVKERNIVKGSIAAVLGLAALGTSGIMFTVTRPVRNTNR